MFERVIVTFGWDGIVTKTLIIRCLKGFPAETPQSNYVTECSSEISIDSNVEHKIEGKISNLENIGERSHEKKMFGAIHVILDVLRK